MRLGVLTGGGDCPGLNAALRAVVRKAVVTYEDEVVGFRDGWRGPLNDDVVPLTIERCRGILPRGGTILGTSRTNPFVTEGGAEAVMANLERQRIDAIIAIGGEGTLRATSQFSGLGVPVIGLPKTIDNDVNATDATIGFATAVQVAVDAIDRLHTTAEAHDRVMVCEVMGRRVGWIALSAGIAAGAAIVILPEDPFDIDTISGHLTRRHETGRYASIVVVAEGARPRAGGLELPRPTFDEFDRERLGGIGAVIAKAIEERTSLESRVTALGHIQRGGSPCAVDRLLATRFGIAAVEAAHDGAFGEMVALEGSRITRVPLAAAVEDLKFVPLHLRESLTQLFLD